MTEQEAEVYVKRLTRIWGIESPEGGPNCEPESNRFYFSFYVVKGICLAVSVLDGQTSIELEDVDRWELSCTGGQIKKAWTYPHGEEPRFLGNELEQFAAQWMPFFRRGCWLLGCPIEASAHEKMEWIQGFSREEIESWNLKM